MEQSVNVEKHRIMVVDDEENILNAVRRELLTPPFGRHQYEIELFVSPQAALQRAQEETFEAVISDYRMPEMDGLDFLRALAGIQPDCARLVLSGQTDFDSLIRMINETHIYRFIPKPWRSYFLKSSLAQAIDTRRVLLENRRQAAALQAEGISLPDDAFEPVDNILIVEDDLAVAQAIGQCLAEVGQIDEVFGEVRQSVRHAHVAKIDPARIRVHLARTPAQAMKMARETHFSCVIAGYHMPSLDGVHFFEELTAAHPDCACIMVSAEVGMDGVVEALDAAHIFAFIARPWSDFVLRATVAEALAHRRLRQEARLLAEMCRARNLSILD